VEDRPGRKGSSPFREGKTANFGEAYAGKRINEEEEGSGIKRGLPGEKSEWLVDGEVTGPRIRRATHKVRKKISRKGKKRYRGIWGGRNRASFPSNLPDSL